MFNGGVTFLKHHTRISQSPRIYEVYGYAANFYMVHKAVYDRILDGHPTSPDDYKDPIDVYYANAFRIWTSTPYIAKQRPGKSDISEQPTDDYTDFFDTSERILLSDE
jgi:hypothetical protein